MNDGFQRGIYPIGPFLRIGTAGDPVRSEADRPVIPIIGAEILRIRYIGIY